MKKHSVKYDFPTILERSDNNLLSQTNISDNYDTPGVFCI